jgi:MoaA/NifB/PqqE/SkfB family radical SAM enzyme
MSNIDKRMACVLYLTATCNLNCVYCYIDKSPAL